MGALLEQPRRLQERENLPGGRLLRSRKHYAYRNREDARWRGWSESQELGLHAWTVDFGQQEEAQQTLENQWRRPAVEVPVGDIMADEGRAHALCNKYVQGRSKPGKRAVACQSA
mmetsp:Transcript_9192/g.19994  ORF Transcript_9192/g.19994 Transcript_9192/m.19994 type:complete len:115 (-) Transcript_9192:65-409(-)